MCTLGTRSVAGILILLVSQTIRAQTDTIYPNPNAVQLRRVWVKTGNLAEEDVGMGLSPVGDIDGDGRNEFGVWSHFDRWQIFGIRTAPDSPLYSFRSVGVDPARMVTGNFVGTGHQVLLFPMDSCTENLACYYRLFGYSTETGRIDSTPSVIIRTGIQACPRALIAQDLDGDGADELILARQCTYPEIWIYRGGERFGLDEPLKIGDTELGTSQLFFAAAGDFDGDRQVDLLTGGFYGAGAALKFYWGDGTLGGWAHSPRIVRLTSTGHPRVGLGLTVLDCDGDGIADLCLPGPDGRTYLFRSRGTNKDAKVRAFDLNDADNRFRFYGWAASAGFLADSNRRFEALALEKGQILIFTGAPTGIDSKYEAQYDYPNEYGFINKQAVGDCTGDGWDDFLAGSHAYASGRGIAALYAGGPYIPVDDTASGVRQYELDGKANGLSVWPNPMRDHLEIAWRGDLHRMPAAFAVYDETGRLVASGSVPVGYPSAIWRASPSLPDGAYRLTVLDANGRVLGVAGVCRIRD